MERWDGRYPRIHDQAVQKYTSTHMKKLIALAIMTLASQAVVIFAGEPMVSLKQVIASSTTPRRLSFSDQMDSILEVWDICDRRWLRRTCRPAPQLGRRYGPHLLVPVEIRGCEIPRGWTQYWFRQRFTNQRSDCRSRVRSRHRNRWWNNVAAGVLNRDLVPIVEPLDYKMPSRRKSPHD